MGSARGTIEYTFENRNEYDSTLAQLEQNTDVTVLSRDPDNLKVTVEIIVTP